VHLVSNDATMAEAAVRRTLEAAGIALTGIRPVEPSLEDVFIAVLGNDRQGGRP
jgi:ABC-2 type transport system ATP-binding protein